MMNKRYFKIAVLMVVAAIGVLLLGACGPAEVSEPAIPADFITYTDAAELFSISYPPDWMPDISLVEGSEEVITEILAAMEADLPMEEPSIIFFGGVKVETGYMPNVNILVESLPGIEFTHSSMIDAEIQNIKDFIPDYQESSRIKTTVGGREATIVDWEGTYPGLGRGHWLQMFTLVGKAAWIVTCTVPLVVEDSDDRIDEYNAIVRSLRLSR